MILFSFLVGSFNEVWLNKKKEKKKKKGILCHHTPKQGTSIMQQKLLQRKQRPMMQKNKQKLINALKNIGFINQSTVDNYNMV